MCDRESFIDKSFSRRFLISALFNNNQLQNYSLTYSKFTNVPFLKCLQFLKLLNWQERIKKIKKEEGEILTECGRREWECHRVNHEYL
jgi:hypothetical protein